MKFRWEGFTVLGQQKIGEIEAENESIAAGLLRSLGIMTQNIQPDDGEPFKSVLPDAVYQPPAAAYPIEDRRNVDQAELLEAEKQEIKITGTKDQMPALLDRAKMLLGQEEDNSDPSLYWQSNLKKNLADIQKVMNYVRQLDPNIHGAYMAEEEMNKQAIIKAFKEMR